jgi:hypothetical protein
MDFNNHFNFKRSFLKMLRVLAFISAPVISDPCTNIFPKVFGADQANGGTLHTYLYSMDIYSDYLALGGRTNS